MTRLPMSAPDDVRAIEAAIAAGEIDPVAVCAVFAKTEGNGCVNDFTRSFAVRAVQDCLAAHRPVESVASVAMVMSGGTEGGLAPHWLVCEALPERGAAGADALAIGVHVTEPLLPEDIGRMAQVKMVAAGVRAALEHAGIADAGDVHFVQVKCPLVTAGRVAEAKARGAVPKVSDTLKSMGQSRGASALGVAVALGEVTLSGLSDERIGADTTVFSARASTSAGVELLGHEIVVLGRSNAWSGPLTIDSALMGDAVDVSGLQDLLERNGLMVAGRMLPGEGDRLVALLAKAEPSTSGQLRGHRHTMLDDSDISATRHARGFVAGALAGVVGHAEIFVSGGAEHQGPDGGGPLAAIIRRRD